MLVRCAILVRGSIVKVRRVGGLGEWYVKEKVTSAREKKL
jgi:hypothetical protein